MLVIIIRCPFHNLPVCWQRSQKDLGLQLSLSFLATMPVESNGRCCFVLSG